MAVSREAGLDPRTIESLLLQWHDAGRLRYRGIGRDMLLALPEPPGDSRQRVTAMLADYHAGKDGRIGEIMAYATTHRCRHGYISAYFGGRPIERCTACDNCLGTVAQSPRPRRTQTRRTQRQPKTQPSPRHTTANDPARTILEGVSSLPYPLGVSGLARALQGAGTSPLQPDRFPFFGALSHWTQKDIRQFISQMISQGLLEQYQKGAYPLLRLSGKGTAWLKGDTQQPDSPELFLPMDLHPRCPQSTTRPYTRASGPGDWRQRAR